MMMRRYQDAIRTFSNILLYNQRTKHMVQNRTYVYDQVRRAAAARGRHRRTRRRCRFPKRRSPLSPSSSSSSSSSLFGVEFNSASEKKPHMIQRSSLLFISALSFLKTASKSNHYYYRLPVRNRVPRNNMQTNKIVKQKYFQRAVHRRRFRKWRSRNTSYYRSSSLFVIKFLPQSNLANCP